MGAGNGSGLHRPADSILETSMKITALNRLKLKS